MYLLGNLVKLWFASNHVWMWELNHKEGWASVNWCFWTVVLEKTLETPLDCKEIQPVNTKGISPEYSLEGLMLKLQYFGHLMWRTDSLEKTHWCWESLKAGEANKRGWDGWMPSLTRQEFEQALEVGDGQGSLACCNPWGCKESDTTEWLNCLSSRFLSTVLWSWMTHLVSMLSQNACCGWGAWCNSLSFAAC